MMFRSRSIVSRSRQDWDAKNALKSRFTKVLKSLRSRHHPDTNASQLEALTEAFTGAGVISRENVESAEYRR